MEEIKKLKVLVKHWRDHNNEHADTYDSWAQKMSIAGNDEAERILKEISIRTKEVTPLFEDLEDILS
jgi:chitinase